MVQEEGPGEREDEEDEEGEIGDVRVEDGAAGEDEDREEMRLSVIPLVVANDEPRQEEGGDVVARREDDAETTGCEHEGDRQEADGGDEDPGSSQAPVGQGRGEDREGQPRPDEEGGEVAAGGQRRRILTALALAGEEGEQAA